MERTIALSDLNACYASIEIARRPELRGKPVAVCGSAEARHGIILAKSEEAKRCGIKTGMVRWQAMRLCPGLITLPPNLDLYMSVTDKVRELYSNYSNLRDDFSIDESWIDLTGTCRSGREVKIAFEIKERLKKEIGLTASIGVSFNKVFAKLGSDIAGPDNVTEITRDNMKDVVWPLPAQSLIGVGRATSRALSDMGIYTLGELAAANPDLLKRRLGKNGIVLYAFANGIDNSPVGLEGTGVPVKSIGNSATTARDMVCDDDVRVVLFVLSESVGKRLRDSYYKGYVVEISLRTPALTWLSHQRKLKRATSTTREIFDIAFELFREARVVPLRSIGVRVASLVDADEPEQLNLFVSEDERAYNRKIDKTVDLIRDEFGYNSICRGVTATAGDLMLSQGGV